ncbi:uncharacterized protein LOC135830423 isoform X2 [Sycon ciliatum]|uniref:uncharacterized protein LOC135830423 isoform X2 n=1 Tax=Sycon ciliatum TaxID=27933 RepID=UPI0031F60122
MASLALETTIQAGGQLVLATRDKRRRLRTDYCTGYCTASAHQDAVQYDSIAPSGGRALAATPGQTANSSSNGLAMPARNSRSNSSMSNERDRPEGSAAGMGAVAAAFASPSSSPSDDGLLRSAVARMQTYMIEIPSKVYEAYNWSLETGEGHEEADGGVQTAGAQESGTYSTVGSSRNRSDSDLHWASSSSHAYGDDGADGSSDTSSQHTDQGHACSSRATSPAQARLSSDRVFPALMPGGAHSNWLTHACNQSREDSSVCPREAESHAAAGGAPPAAAAAAAAEGVNKPYDVPGLQGKYAGHCCRMRRSGKIVLALCAVIVCASLALSASLYFGRGLGDGQNHGDLHPNHRSTDGAVPPTPEEEICYTSSDHLPNGTVYHFNHINGNFTALPAVIHQKGWRGPRIQVNKSITWDCDKQYSSLVNKASDRVLTCRKDPNGTTYWQGKNDNDLSCFDIHHVCQNPPLHYNGPDSPRVIFSKRQSVFLVNDVVSVSCPPNYRPMITDSTYFKGFRHPFEGGQLRCRYPGQWEPRGLVYCERKKDQDKMEISYLEEWHSKCRAAAMPALQQLQETGQLDIVNYAFDYQTRATPRCLFQCSDGYTGRNKAWECEFNETSRRVRWTYFKYKRWQAGIISCQPRTCVDPTSLVSGDGNGSVRTISPASGGYKYRDTVDLQCQGVWAHRPATLASRYQTVRVQCQSDGSWSQTNLSCWKSPCRHKQCSVDCSHWFRQTSLSADSNVHVSHVFTRVGSDHSLITLTEDQCSANQQRLTFGSGEFLNVRCDQSQSSQTCRHSPFSADLVFECNDRTCSLEVPGTGESVNSALATRRRACVSPSDLQPVDGLERVMDERDRNGLDNGTTIYYRCKAGYQMEEGHSGIVTCADGRWSDAPHCFAEEQCDRIRPAQEFFADYPVCRTERKTRSITGVAGVTTVSFLEEICETGCQQGALGNGQLEHWTLRCTLLEDGTYGWIHKNVTCWEGCRRPPTAPPGARKSQCSAAGQRQCSTEGDFFQAGTTLTYNCPGGWIDRASPDFSTMCIGGDWTETLPRMPSCRRCKACKVKNQWLSEHYNISTDAAHLVRFNAEQRIKRVKHGGEITVTCASGSGDVTRRHQCYDGLCRQDARTGRVTGQATRRWRESPVTFECQCEPSSGLAIVSAVRGLKCEALPPHLQQLENCTGRCEE